MGKVVERGFEIVNTAVVAGIEEHPAKVAEQAR